MIPPVGDQHGLHGLVNSSAYGHHIIYEVGDGDHRQIFYTELPYNEHIEEKDIGEVKEVVEGIGDADEYHLPCVVGVKGKYRLYPVFFAYVVGEHDAKGQDDSEGTPE